MLCILREDFMLELRGIVAAELGALDANETAFRRVYFWRNSLRTLEEIRHTLNSLSSEASFREALLQEGSEVREAFDGLRRELNKASSDYLQGLRNTLGAHLDGPTIKRSLNETDPLKECLIEMGETVESTHYRFATEILQTALLPGVPERRKISAL
jgi:hypothetical protein